MVNNYDVAVLSEKVAYLEGAIKTAGVLPDVSASDNGATLQVVGGVWDVGDPIPGVVNALDSTSTSDALSAAQGKALNDAKIGMSSLNDGTLTGETVKAYLTNLGAAVNGLEVGRYVFRHSYSGNWSALVIASVMTKGSVSQIIVSPLGQNKIYIGYTAAGSFLCYESPAFTAL